MTKASDLEKEGERVLTELMDRLQKRIPQGMRETAEQWTKDAEQWLKMVRESTEQSFAKAVEQIRAYAVKEFEHREVALRASLDKFARTSVERMKVVTQKDLNVLGGTFRATVRDQTAKALERLRVPALRKEVQEVAKEVKSLKKEVTRKKPSSPTTKKRVAAKKSTAARKKRSEGVRSDGPKKVARKTAKVSKTESSGPVE